MSTPTRYDCAACGGTFDATWSDDEADAERKANGFEHVECDVVCDTCYEKLKAKAARLLFPWSLN